MAEPSMSPVGIAQYNWGGKNIINPMRLRHKKDIVEEKSYLYNITNYTWDPIYRTHGVTVIVGNEAIDRVPEELIGRVYQFDQKDGIKYSRITIHGRIELVEAGIESSRGVTYREESTEADEICEDMCNVCNENRPRVEDGTPSFSGVFWSKNEEPTSKQLKDAQKKLFAYYHALVEEGNRIYLENMNSANPLKDRPEGMMKVAFKTLKAAGQVKEDVAWVFIPTSAAKTDLCLACKSPMPTGALRCPSCHAFQIEDKDILRKYYPGEFPAVSEAIASLKPEHKK